MALAGGASILDVKEPDHGSLGRAPFPIWRDVSAAIDSAAPISVALGELGEWVDPHSPIVPQDVWHGISYRKLGLARAEGDWRMDWRRLRSRLDERGGPGWIAVVYADWQEARAPAPDVVLDTALESSEIVGVLVDTWDKTHRLKMDPGRHRWIERVRREGKFLAIAGGLDLDSIARLEPFEPDIVAVRGAACVGGDRRSSIDPRRVADLARAVAALPAGRELSGVGPLDRDDQGGRMRRSLSS
jgi:(5-formylfuran-3-yl)methyl phosphate synthase